MKLGVVYPQTEIGADPKEVTDFARGVVELGFDHFQVYEHVVGGDPAVHPQLKSAPYDMHSQFHEPFVLYGFLAAVAPELELVTAIVILPQRQTALVAKQAASVDRLTQGKFRLGVGLGWNPIEYEALGQPWKGRAKRFEEQIELLRELFKNPSITFNGDYHKVTAAGLNPLPIDGRIPIWVGAQAEPAVRRAARIADGFFPLRKPDSSTWKDEIDKLHGYLDEYGRDPKTFGIEATVRTAGKNPDEWHKEIEEWRSLGATHVCIHTMGDGVKGGEAHLERLEAVAEAASIKT